MTTIPIAVLGLTALLATPLLAVAQDDPPAPRREAVLLEDVTCEARLYDVRDLAQRDAHDSTGPRLRLTVPGADDDEPPVANREAAREVVVTQLANVIRAFIEPPLEPGEAVQPVGSTHVVVNGRSEQHAWVEAFLARHRARGSKTVVLEAELYLVPAEIWGTLGLGDGPRVLDHGDESGLLARLQNAELDRMSAPRVAIRSFDHMQMSSLTHTSYIREFRVERVEIDGRQQAIADPVIDVVRDGIVLDGTAGELDAGVIAVDLGVDMTKLQRPIPTVECRLDGLPDVAPVKIQLPRVDRVEARVTARLTDGGRVVLGAPALDGRHPVLLVRASIVADDPAKPGAVRR
ncbi:MAG: hypothetical protein IPM29_30640 [Planctomycetes bacterium]|nr:hypothetical protein [Planctomycetota bacterium]